MVSIGQGGGHNGNGGRGARNKALDIKSKLIRPSPGKSPLATLNKSLAPTPSTVINPDTTPVSRRIDELNVHPEDEDYDYDSAPTLDIKNKSNKPILNKSLAPTSSPVINPDTTPDSGGSMFESETGEEEPDDKDKDKENTTKKEMPNYAQEEGEVPGRDWTEEEYSDEETTTASATTEGYGEDYVDPKHLSSFQKSSIWHKYFDKPPKSPIWHKYFDLPPTSTTPVTPAVTTKGYDEEENDPKDLGSEDYVLLLLLIIILLLLSTKLQNSPIWQNIL